MWGVSGSGGEGCCDPWLVDVHCGVFQGLVERDDQIRELREEMLNVQRTLEEQISEERAALQDTQVGECVCVCVCVCIGLDVGVQCVCMYVHALSLIHI